LYRFLIICGLFPVLKSPLEQRTSAGNVARHSLGFSRGSFTLSDAHNPWFPHTQVSATSRAWFLRWSAAPAVLELPGGQVRRFRIICSRHHQHLTQMLMIVRSHGTHGLQNAGVGLFS
jgi:hypothetical protein